MIIRRKPIGIENLRKPSTLGMSLQRNAVQRMLARQVQRYIPGDVTNEAVDFTDYQDADGASDDGYQNSVEDAIRRAEATDPNASQAAPRRVSRTPNWAAAPLNQPAASVRRSAQPNTPAAPPTPATADAPASASPFTTRQGLDQGDTMPGDLVAIMNLHRRLQAEDKDPIMQPLKTDPRLAVYRTPAKAPPARGTTIPQSKTEILGKESMEPVPPTDDAEPPRIRRRALITDMTPPKKGLPFGDDAQESPSQPLGEPVQRDMAQALYAPPSPRESHPAALTQGHADAQSDDTEPSTNDYAALENYQAPDNAVQRTYEDAVQDAIRRAEGPTESGDSDVGFDSRAVNSRRDVTAAQPSSVQPTRADRPIAVDGARQSRSAGTQLARIQRTADSANFSGGDDDLSEFADAGTTAIQRTADRANFSGGDGDLTEFADAGTTAIQRTADRADFSGGDGDLSEFANDLPHSSATAIQRAPNRANFSGGNGDLSEFADAGTAAIQRTPDRADDDDNADFEGGFQDAGETSIQRDYTANDASGSGAQDAAIVPSGYADSESYTSALNAAIHAAEAPDTSSAAESMPGSVSRRTADAQPRQAVQRTSPQAAGTDPRRVARRTPELTHNESGSVAAAAPDYFNASSYQNNASSFMDESSTSIDTVSEAPTDSPAAPVQAVSPSARSTIRRKQAATQDASSGTVADDAAAPAAFVATDSSFEPQSQAEYSTQADYSSNAPAQDMPFVQRAPADDIAEADAPNESRAVDAPSGYADADQYNDAVTAAIRAAEAPPAPDNAPAPLRTPRQVQRTSRRDAPAQDAVNESFDAEEISAFVNPEQAASDVVQDAAPRGEQVRRTASRTMPDAQQSASQPDVRTPRRTTASAAEPSVSGNISKPRQAIQRTPQGYTSAEDYQAAIEQAASQAEAAPASDDVAMSVDRAVEQPRRSSGKARNTIQPARAEMPIIREPDTNPVMPPDNEPDSPAFYPPIDPPSPGISDPDQPGIYDPPSPGISDPDQPGIYDPEQPGISDPTGPAMPGTASAAQSAVQRYPEAYTDEDSYQAAVNDAIRAAEAPTTVDAPSEGGSPRARSAQNSASGRDAPRTTTARTSTVQPTRNPTPQQSVNDAPVAGTPTARPGRVQRAMQALSRRFADSPDPVAEESTAYDTDDTGGSDPQAVQRYAAAEYDDVVNSASTSYSAEVPSGYASHDAYQDAVNAAIQGAEAPPDRPARRTPGVQRTSSSSRGVAQAQNGSRGVFVPGEMSDSAPSLEEDALNSAGDSLPLNSVDLASALGLTTGQSVQRTLSNGRESSTPSQTEAGLLQLLNLPPDTRIARPTGTYTSPEATRTGTNSASQSSSGPAAQASSGSVQREMDGASPDPVNNNSRNSEAGEQEPSGESVETMAQAVFKILKKKLRTEQDRSKGGR